MTSKGQKGTISFRFNSKSGDDQLEEVLNYDDENKSSGVNSESSSRASTPMKSSELKQLSDILSSTTPPSTSKVKSSNSDGSVKDFFASKLSRGRTFDHPGSSDDSNIPSASFSPGSSAKWFNESWRKFQQIIEERKEKSTKEKKDKDKESPSPSIASSSGFDTLSETGDISEKFFRSVSLTETIKEETAFPCSTESTLENLNKTIDKDDISDSFDVVNKIDSEHINRDDDEDDDLFKQRPKLSSHFHAIDSLAAGKNETGDDNELLQSEQRSPSPSKELSFRIYNYLASNWCYFKSPTGLLYLFSSLVALLAIIITLRLPFPSYVNGFIFGVTISFLVLLLFAFYLLSMFLKPSEEDQLKAWDDKFKSTNVFNTTVTSSISTSPISASIQTKDDADSQVIHKEWFHELVSSHELGSNEKGKKHVKTQLVFIRLQGSCLRVSEPQSKNIKARKLTENSYTNFANQRHYELINLRRLYLWLPNSIRNKKKYLWIKKYPIILEIDGISKGKAEATSAVNGASASTSSVSSSTATDGSNGSNKTTKLILFARTNRSKEQWYWRFKDASKDLICDVAEEMKPSDEIFDSNSSDHSPVTPTQETPTKPKDCTPSSVYHKYEAYMHQILNHRISIYRPGYLPTDDGHLLWFNTLLGRVLFEFLNNQHWSHWAAKKIQRKLSRIKLPYFMQTLTLKNIDLGQNLPRFISVPKPPVINEDGVWIDFQIDYCGGFAMTLETKLNLMRLKDQGTVEKEMKPIGPGTNQVDMDDFSEPESIVSSSEDDEKDEFKEKIVDSEGNNGAKILKFVDKLAASKYFQQATDYKYIKRAMEGVSNTPLILTVFVQELSGTLSINLPPPPSDRLWYGFRGDPNLVLSARPRLGEHRVSMSHAIEWIEKKLQQEFNKLLVIPNMDDIILQVMMASNSNIDIQ